MPTATLRPPRNSRPSPAAEADAAIHLSEGLSDTVRQIGFYHAAPSAREFLQELISEARKIVAETV